MLFQTQLHVWNKIIFRQRNSIRILFHTSNYDFKKVYINSQQFCSLAVLMLLADITDVFATMLL